MSPGDAEPIPRRAWHDACRVPPRVVVADDHDAFRRGVGAMLERAGIWVVGEAADGDEALRVVHRELPDLAVLDLRMPGLSGAEVARTLRREGSTTRVLVLSAYSDPELVVQAAQNGVAGYLSKDASRREIVDAVLRCSAGGHVLPATLDQDDRATALHHIEAAERPSRPTRRQSA